MVHHVSAEDRLCSLRVDRNGRMIDAVTGGGKKTDSFEDLAPIDRYALHPTCCFKWHHAIEKHARYWNASRRTESGFRPHPRDTLLIAGSQRDAISPLQVPGKTPCVLGKCGP